MKYKVTRMPIEAYIREKNRRDEIAFRLSKLRNKKVRIPMTDYFLFKANKSIFIYDDELLNAFGKNKKGYMNL